ncbi:MAG TPA: XRE family transcriptional regulator [Citreicella sp.]|nr:XRE family transcriptional regulator [Citreicella sp.]
MTRHYSGRAFNIAQFYTCPMGLRIKELREAKGWTQLELAERASMSRTQLTMIENETRPANTLRLNAIAAALGVPTEALFESDTKTSRIMELLRHISPEDQAVLLRMAEALASKHDDAQA